MDKFKVNKALLNGKFKKCLICEKKFKLGEEIILLPIQESLKGWATALAIPLHLECYYIKK